MRETYRFSMVSGLERCLPLIFISDLRSSQARDWSFVLTFSRGTFNVLQVYHKFLISGSKEIVPV